MKWPPWLILTIGFVAGIAIGLMLAPWRMTGQSQTPLWLEVVHRILTSVGGLGNVQIGAKLRLFADPGGVPVLSILPTVT